MDYFSVLLCVYKYGFVIPVTFTLFLYFIARLFHQAFISFRKYIMESSSVSADLHIILNDICCGAGKYLECL